MSLKLSQEHNVNEVQFFNPSSPESAYLLGLLWADGCISFAGSGASIRLKINLDDGKEFKKVFLKTGKWNIYCYETKRYKTPTKPIMLIQTNNRPLANFLVENGYKSKSEVSACSILSKIPQNLHLYWFRGLFDGDGCVYVNTKNSCFQVAVTSSYEQDWTYLVKFIQPLNINFTIKKTEQKNGNRYSQFRITGKRNCETFLNLIYLNSEKDAIYLPRKYQKFQELKNYNYLRSPLKK